MPMTNLDLSNNSVINVNAIQFSDGSILTGAGSIGSNYLAYPNAQGTENMLDTNVNGTLTVSTGGLVLNSGTVNMLNGSVSFTNALTPPVSLALQPAASDASTKMPTTAWVQSAIGNGLTGYAKLANNQTFTGTNQFSLQTTFNAGLISNNTMYSQALAGIKQWEFTDLSNGTIGSVTVNNNLFLIYSGGNNGTQQYQMKDPSGIIQTVLTLNYTSPNLNTLNPLTQSATMPAATDSSTKTPTTAWVQGAISNGLSTSGVFYLANNNLATGQNTFQNSLVNIPLTIKNTSSSTGAFGCHYVSYAGGSFNPMVLPNQYVIYGDSAAGINNGVLTLTTHSTTNAGVKITNNKAQMGAGGNVTSPANSVVVDGSANEITITGTSSVSLQSSGPSAIGITNTNVTLYGGPLYLDGTTNVSPLSFYQLGYQVLTPQPLFSPWTTTAQTTLFTWGPFQPTGAYPYGTYCFDCKIALTGSNFMVSISNVNTLSFSQAFTYGVLLSGSYVANVSIIIPIYSSQSIYLVGGAQTTPFVVQSFSTCTITRIA